MRYLNIVYFLIISIVGLKYLFSNGGIVRSPFNKDEYLKLDGPEMFWCLTFSTGLLALSADVGLDLMAVRLLVLEIFCIVGLTVTQNKPVWSTGLYIYVAYLIWITIGCFYGPSISYGIRVVLKYLYPLLLCLFASAAVSQIEVWLKAGKLARLIALISIFPLAFPFLYTIISGVFWYPTARIINFIAIMVFSLGLFFFTNEKKKNLIWTIIFLLPCFVAVFRTSILGSGIAIMAFSFIKYRLKSLPIIFGVLIIGVAAVFTIPSLRAKMFYDDSVTWEQYKSGKADEQLNTNMRAYMWEDLESRFFEDNKVIGCGTGTIQNWMYANSGLYGGLTVPHSDFVQMKCDNGLVGLWLYCAMIAFIFIDCYRRYWRTDDPEIRLAAIVAGSSLLGIFATCYSDNTVNYSMATLSMPFGFYGMLLGMDRRRQMIEQGLICDVEDEDDEVEVEEVNDNTPNAVNNNDTK